MEKDRSDQERGEKIGRIESYLETARSLASFFDSQAKKYASGSFDLPPFHFPEDGLHLAGEFRNFPDLKFPEGLSGQGKALSHEWRSKINALHLYPEQIEILHVFEDIENTEEARSRKVAEIMSQNCHWFADFYRRIADYELRLIAALEGYKQTL